MGVYLGSRPFVLAISELFRKVPATDGSEMCLLQIQPNGMAPSGGIPDIGSILGGLLGGPLSPTDATPKSAAVKTNSVPFQSNFPFPPALVVNSRRLQWDQYKNPMEDVWMIGGVFLEHFVTIFDFDGERMGF